MKFITKLFIPLYYNTTFTCQVETMPSWFA